MPEYIEREALFKRLKEETHDYDAVGKYKEGIIKGLNIAKSIVNDKTRTPTADVTAVVRCRECEYLTVHNSPTLYAYCEKTHLRFEPFKTDTRTHFCSYGKRKEGAKDA